MIPDSVAGKALGFLLTKYLVVATEFLWYFIKVRFFYLFGAHVGVYCCTSYVILMRGLRPRNIAHSWNELGTLGVWGS